MSRKKRDLDRNALDDPREVAGRIVRRQQGELRSAGEREALELVLRSARPEPRRRKRSRRNAESACDAARAGLGVTVAFSHHVSEFVKEGTLTAVLDEFQPAPLPVSLVYASNRFMPIKLRAFLDFAAPRMKGRLSGRDDPSPF